MSKCLRRDLIQPLDDDDVVTFENHYEAAQAARRMLPSDYGGDGPLSPYSAYSPSAVAEAKRVVYANYATEEDFQTLRYSSEPMIGLCTDMSKKLKDRLRDPAL